VIDLRGRVQQSGLSIKQLSKRADLPINRIEQLLTGSEPTLMELRKLASALRMRISDLLPKTQVEDKAEFLFRKKLDMKVGEKQADVISRLSRFISHSLEFLPPEKASPAWTRLFEASETTFTEAERLARSFRSEFYDDDQFGPLLTLPTLAAEKLNILLLVVPEQAVDGASAIIAGHVFIFVSPKFEGRMLFTLAHEIAHCLSHHNADLEYAVFDGVNEVGKLRKRVRDQEGFADAFASCLLMPAGGVAVALKKVREITKTAPSEPVGDIHILYLSRIFGVSFEVSARRCEDLELLPPGGAYSLAERLREEFGSPEKRASTAGLPPRPPVEFPKVPMKLLTAAIEKIKRGEISVGRASNYLNISLSDLIEAHATSAQ